MGAEALIDIASLDSAADAAAANDSAVDTTVDTSVADSTTEGSTDTTTADSAAEGTETETTNADGSEKSAEEQAAFKSKAADKVAADKAIDTEATPQNVRKALKGLRDADPKNAQVVKELHGAFERWNAAKALFPKGVEEMKETKAFIDAIGGVEGYQQTQEAMEAVKASDELLYNADPQLSKNVWEDMKAQGKEGAYSGVVANFLDHLKEVDSNAYYEKIMPHFFNGLVESGLGVKLQQLGEALNAKDAEGKPAPDVKMISAIQKIMSDWYKGMETDEANRKKAPEDTPERKKFLAEKEAFEKEKTTAAQEKQKAFEESVATECDKYNNTALSKPLGEFLRMPFFKDFPRETKIDLGNGIKERLYANLKADKAYQIQMKNFWGAKQPDRAKMVEYHKAKLDSIAGEIVRTVVQNRYPGYAKGGSAAGRVAVATAKKAADTKAATTSVASNKPIYVASRPTDLVRDGVVVNGREYSASDLITLQISGKGFVKSGTGFKFVTWRK